MNLAEALGIVDWQDQRLERQDAEHSEVANQQSLSELWVWSVDLDTFWDDDQDPRWRLLLNMVQALGFSADHLLPCDQPEDKPEDAWGIAFGRSAANMVSLPALNDLLTQPALKKQTWQTLCQQLLVHG